MHLYSAHRSKTNTIKNTKPETLILIYKLSLWEILAEKSFMHVYRTLFLKSAKNEEAFHVYIHVQRKTTLYNFLIQITYLFSCTSLIDILPCYQNVNEIKRKGSLMFKSSVSIVSNVSDDAVTPLPLKKMCMVIIVNKTQNTPT